MTALDPVLLVAGHMQMTMTDEALEDTALVVMVTVIEAHLVVDTMMKTALAMAAPHQELDLPLMTILRLVVVVDSMTLTVATTHQLTHTPTVMEDLRTIAPNQEITPQEILATLMTTAVATSNIPFKFTALWSRMEQNRMYYKITQR